MQAWGISLIAIGGLSFLLPLLGRQFILVSLVGLTGTGSVFAGLILICIGGLLLYIGKKQEETDLGVSSAAANWQTKPEQPQRANETLSDSELSRSTVSTESSASEFPPNVVGNRIAQTLDKSCAIGTISGKERMLLESANIPLAHYRDELLVLAGFSQDYAIHQLLQHSPLHDEVLRGYRDAWTNLGRHSGAGRVQYEKFLERCPIYAAAAANLDEGAISPIALAFGQFLGADNNDAQILALSFADGVFFSHFEGVKYALKKGNMLPASAGNA